MSERIKQISDSVESKLDAPQAKAEALIPSLSVGARISAKAHPITGGI
jgi:hypothetical protein